MSDKQQEKKGTPESPRNQARRERVRFSGPRRRLQVDEEHLNPNYKYHWFNDQNDELGQAERAGYVYVKKSEINDPTVIGDSEVHGGNSDMNSNVSRVVGVNRANGPLRAYFMKIERSVYEGDQEWREKEVNMRVDEALRAGRPSGSSVQNSYGLKVDYKPGGK